MRKLSVSVAALFFAAFSQAQSLTPVSNFGTNPGNLTMYYHAPAQPLTPAPIVVAMHGCTQTATQYATDSDWNKLANLYGFYVIFPEQKAANNSSSCFNWFLPGDQERGQGEAASINQMVQYLRNSFNVDTSRIFVTGLSAGGSMTSIMLAAYPDVFSAGAVMSGCPYKSATNSGEAWSAMGGTVNKTPSEWAALAVSTFPTFQGTYPKLAVFQGLADNTVYPVNMTELAEQFTALHNADATADEVISSYQGIANVTYSKFNDNTGNCVVETYSIATMGHAISINPGLCPWQGGVANIFASDKDFFSSWYALRFFDLFISKVISGPDTIASMQEGLTFSVENTAGSTYSWDGPPDISVVSGDGTNEVVVNWGYSSGEIEVSETNADGCTFPLVTKHVFVDPSLQMPLVSNDLKISVFPSVFSDVFYVSGIANTENVVIEIFDVLGKNIPAEVSHAGGVNVVHAAGNAHGICIVRIRDNQEIHTFRLIRK
ncbi:MAG: PHB depolymerase family esterase [Bacteroidetes bacterium]|nr:PHB depolymerase family esterase [Bacteroidota bacterium]MBU1721025.1 PHB depolymerase family esterase [Bacteroidota bacterium]